MSGTSVRLEIARNIKTILETRDMTQAEFARRVGSSTKHVNQVLGGSTVASMETLEYWCYLLDYRIKVELEEL